MSKDVDPFSLRELAVAIVAEDRRLREAIVSATQAIASVRDTAEVAEELARLAAIAQYSACIAKRTRRAAIAADHECERRALQGHLRTLRVLGDVLCLTAPRPVE